MTEAYYTISVKKVVIATYDVLASCIADALDCFDEGTYADVNHETESEEIIAVVKTNY